MTDPAAAAYVLDMTRNPALLVAVALTSLATLAGCALSGPERVGGEPAPQAHELTMLDLFGQGVTPFAAEVERLSEGRMRIRVIPAGRDADADFEGATIRDLQQGRADLAFAGTRAWDEFGALSLRALGAPFLVDSYPLQERVLTSELVEPMLHELEPSGLVGIGILPGPIRRPFGVTHALADPTDFQGLTIGTQQSNVADATLRALGARPQRLPFDVSTYSQLASLDGLELQIQAIETWRLDAEGSHLTTNVNLWPRQLVLFADAQAYEDLSEDERQILRTAADTVVASTTAAEQSLEAESAANLCRNNHTTFDSATPQQLRDLRHAVEPVYAELERDPGTRSAIEAIQLLKNQLAEPPTVVPACTPASGVTSGEVTAIDGTWTMDTDRSAAVPEHFDENWGHWVFTFDRGRFAITQENETSCTWGYGTFAVNGSRTAWSFVDGGGIAPNGATNKPGEYFVYDVSAYRDTLALSPVEGEISPLNFRDQPWRRISEHATSKFFSTRCPPPAVALDQ